MNAGRPDPAPAGDAAPLPERVRGLAAGVASPSESARFLESWRAVETALLEAECAAESSAGPCRLRFEDVAERVTRDVPPVTLSRWPLRAAAAVLVVVGVTMALLLTHRGEDGVTLAAIRPETAAVALTEPSPEDAAALRAATAIARLPDDPAPWFSDLDAARDAARATGRVLLVFVQHPTCPICEELEAGPLSDAGVRERIAGCAAVRVNAFAAEGSPLLDRDWPYLAVYSPDGREIAGLPAPCTTLEVRRLLDDALAQSPSAATVSWARARTLGAALDAAELARDDERLGDECDLLATVASSADGGAFASAARRRLAEHARDAAAAFVHAETTARTDADAARRELDESARRFAGTPWGADFAAVGTALARSGRFPDVRSR